MLEDTDLLMSSFNEILSIDTLFLDYDLVPEVGCELLQHSDFAEFHNLFSDSPSGKRSLLLGCSLTLL